ncbi:MAG TPA: HDOD domain-containing protein [Candidatus Eisenbacteria bacterium]|nr:HDOD domain-containing protein [Candidatus Eisenbacteria bacterium]
MDRRLLRRMTEETTILPTLPPVASRLVEAVARMDAETTEEVARILALDPGLTARTLRLANSDCYGFPRKVGSVELAVLVLGPGTIRDLVLTASVVQTLGPSDRALTDLWNHAMACGVAARALGERVQYRLLGEAYAAGLLHDIGAVLLRQRDPERFEAAMALARTQGMPLEEAERSLYGSDHSEVGGWLAERWGLPAEIVEAIACHHEPEKAVRSPELSALVHIADSLADRAGYAWAPAPAPHALSPFAWESVEPDASRREALLAGLTDVVVRETERERELFAEFRGAQEEEGWRSPQRI